MKKRVVLSAYCWVVSVFCMGVLLCMFLWQHSKPDVGWAVWVLLGAVVFLCLMALLYAPVSISLDSGKLTLHTPMLRKSIPVAKIVIVELWPPTMAEGRVIGSGGFFGYYGIFREKSIGRYRAFYGKASNCFLVTLKSGYKYMLGCQDAQQMVAAIKKQMLPIVG